MSIQIKPGYTNPLTMIRGNQAGAAGRQRITGQRDSFDQVRELQNRQQQLQNEILLRKSAGSDSGGISPEQQKAMEEKLEQLSVELRAAKTDSSSDFAISDAVKNYGEEAGLQQLLSAGRVENTDLRPACERISSTKRNRDIYEKSAGTSESAGLYQLKPEEGNSYSISFLPYDEEQ